MTPEVLMEHAFFAAKHSYSPYSGFAVGAALLGENGAIYTGANIENASYGATICAERSAIANACSNNVRSFKQLAVYVSQEVHAIPCGICCQVLAEFCSDDLAIFCASPQQFTKKSFSNFCLRDLLPHQFALQNKQK